jgi:hypothetical protein
MHSGTVIKTRVPEPAITDSQHTLALRLDWYWPKLIVSAVIVIVFIIQAPTSTATTVKVEGKWLLVGIDKLQAAAKLIGGHCDGELAVLIREAGAPLVALNWLHDSGCTKDWISTSVWPIGSASKLAKRLKHLGFSELRQLGADQEASDPSKVVSLFLAKHQESSRIDVWIHCLKATCCIYASESMRSELSKSIARP